jgi:hypothetical protein
VFDEMAAPVPKIMDSIGILNPEDQGDNILHEAESQKIQLFIT